MFSTFSLLALASSCLAVASSNTAGKLPALAADAALFSGIKFDYIIIGAGTAGLTLATRLSEDSGVTVGVIEAGLYHPQEPLITTPGRFGQAIGSAIDWGYLTTPQAGANNTPILLSTGKMVGGSSGLNFMAWTRGSKPEYDAWETLGNGPTWNWNGFLPYFKKVETYKAPPSQGIFPGAQAPTKEDISTFHGNNGPIMPSFNDIYGTDTVPWVQSMNKLGVPTNSDSSNGNGTGVYNLQVSVNRAEGQRSYAANTYFGQSSSRPNLHVLTNAVARRVVFSKTKQGQKLVASGVEYTFGRQTFTASARKEVIVSAGAIQTPKVLEFSGIGNKTLLSRLGIDTLIDLPNVGENLQDQPLVTRDFLLKPDHTGVDELRNNVAFALGQLKQYENSNNGLYAHTVPSIAFVPLSSFIPNDTDNKIAALHDGLLAELKGTQLSPLYSAQLKIQLDWITRKDVAHTEVILWDGGGMTATPPAPDSTYMTVFTSIQHPFSRGSVHINSNNHLDLPVVDPNYLHLSIDAETLGFSGDFVDRLTQTQPLAAKVIKPSTPAAGSDFLKYARETLGTIWHPVGTAPLAPQNLGGVVDPTLIVYGTANLRVVDGSIFPLQIATHPQQTIYAIAEKAADIIKGAKGKN